MKNLNIKKELEYIRQQIINENISYEAIARLQSLSAHISKDDVLLKQGATCDKSNEGK